VKIQRWDSLAATNQSPVAFDPESFRIKSLELVRASVRGDGDKEVIGVAVHPILMAVESLKSARHAQR